MTNNLAFTSFKYVAIDLIGDILYWPIWWYTKGLIKTAAYCLNEIEGQQERLGLAVWAKNLFTPMFGQYDIEGRIISFFIRLVQIIARTILLFVWAILIFCLFLFWLILPVIIGYEIFNNFIGLF
ncbi:MAG: hypothetical protein WC768_01565 [Patescibacteria group bacterium]|jgi:hypothetical protein